MRPLIAAFAAAGLFAAFAPTSAVVHAQLPGAPAGPRFEIAEVRGLAEVPARADMGFTAAVSGPTFAAGTHAVVAKFQTQAPPKTTGLSIVWLKTTGRTPVTLSSSAVDPNELTSGAYSMLTSGSAGLDGGTYQVSVIGADGRIYRTLEFTVRPPVTTRETLATGQPTPAAAEEQGVSLVPYAVEQVGFNYPSYYSVAPVTTGGDNGVLLHRAIPLGGLFVVVKKAGRYNFEAQVRDVIRALSRSGQNQGEITSLSSYDIKRGDIGGLTAGGKLFQLSTQRGPNLNLTMYQTDVDGRSVLLGYLTVANAKTPERSSTPPPPADNGVTAEDFFRMVRSIRSTPAKERPASPTSDPPPRIKRTDVAVVGW